MLPASEHQRVCRPAGLWGIPCALDVLSNLPFAIAGLWGLVLAPGAVGMLDAASRAFAALFFAGLLCTAVGSAVYHWQPQNAGLVVGPHGHGAPFAGLLGLAAGRVSARAGGGLPVRSCWQGAGGGVVGTAATCWPWAVVQLGGMLVVLVLAWCPRDGALPLHLGAVIAALRSGQGLEGAITRC